LIDDGSSSSEWWSDAAGLDSEVYGDPDQHPQKENDWGNINPIGIRACYDEGKRAEETLCFDYLRGHGVYVWVARILSRPAHSASSPISPTA
jgi:hypothetical protein